MSIPQDIKDDQLICLFKNKGSRKDCNNYRTISLLNLVSKLFGRVILSRLQVLVYRVYSRSQCGFRKNRLTINMVFTLWLLQEKCIEQNKPLYFISSTIQKHLTLPVGLDSTKSWRRLDAHQNSHKWSMLFMMEWLQESSLMAVSLNHSPNMWSQARMCDGTHPVWYLHIHPTLLCLFLTRQNSPSYKIWQNLFNLACLRAKTKTNSHNSWADVCLWCDILHT